MISQMILDIDDFADSVGFYVLRMVLDNIRDFEDDPRS